MTETDPAQAAEHRFYFRLFAFIAVTIVVSFAQWSARGMVDIPAIPIWVHAHGLLFVAFLALVLAQQQLVLRSNLALHRRLGWLGLCLAVGSGLLSMYVGIAAIEFRRLPPGFTNALMLSVSQIEAVVFTGFVIAAVAKRRQTLWHRRLILGALVTLLDPALGRLLPGDLLLEWTTPVIAALQLAVLGVAMRRDRTTVGKVHPSLWMTAAIIVTIHVAYTWLSAWPPFIALADSIASA